MLSASPEPEIRDWEAQSGRYRVRFARDARDLEALQRLRYRVFSEELGADLGPSGLDRDPLDEHADHILVVDATETCVGTYRLAVHEHVHPGPGFYANREFDLTALPPEVLLEGVELGRACVHPDHRGRRPLHLLWRGIGAYLVASKKRYLFGCASVPVSDCAAAGSVTRGLAAAGHVDPDLVAPPRRDYAIAVDRGDDGTLEVPPLMRVYFSMGARACATPAYDRDFRTLDFFLLFDLERLDARSYARYCG